MAESSFNIPRHWWGKIIGGVIGLLRGGLSGAFIGILLGHLVDRFLAGIVGVKATQTSFFEALFATLGHLSKADGRVTETEIRMVESLMSQMQITGEDRQRAIRLFNLGKQREPVRYDDYRYNAPANPDGTWPSENPYYGSVQRLSLIHISEPTRPSP